MESKGGAGGGINKNFCPRENRGMRVSHQVQFQHRLFFSAVDSLVVYLTAVADLLNFSAAALVS